MPIIRCPGIIGGGSGAAGAADLQAAYDAATTPPQIVINATPDPLTIDASVVGDVFAVRDTLNQDLLRLSTTGGSVVGGSNAGNTLTLEGALAATADTGIVRVNSPITLAYDTFSNTTPAQQFMMNWGPTFTASGAYIGGALQVAPTVTISTGTFIPATFSDTSNMLQAATPGFSAFTFINELAVIRNSGNFNLMSALVINVGLTHERNTSGTSTTPGTTGLSFSPQTRATVSGAVMTKTDQTAVRVAPTFSTVAGSTVNLGTIRGLYCLQPAVALFQPQAGSEAMTAYYGIDFAAMTFGGTSPIAVVRSALAAGTNQWFLLNNGNCHSDHGAGHIYWDDNAGPALGGVGVGAFDVWLTWNGAGSYYRTFFNSANPSALRWTNPALNRFLFDNDGGNSTGEYNFNCAKFSLGAQTGAVGNQVGVFTTGTRSTGLAGDWSDFLLTHAANLTIDHAIGTASAWTINAASYTIGTGSLTNATVLLIGGNPGNAATDRTGLRIISNPTGGAGINAALYVTAGLSRFDGRVDINNGIALGGGATPTLGTIGGAGPATAAQAQWVEIDIGGTAHWIPVWV